MDFHVPLGGAGDRPASILATGSRVGEFQIEGVIGRGPASVVYRARDRARACDVALKEYLPADIAQRNARGLLVTVAADAATFDAGRRAFLREAMALCRIRHAGLLRVDRAWQHAGTAYAVMAPLQGRTLQQHTEQGRTWTQAELQALLRPLLDLLTVLHRRHCTGLDLRPRQILIQPDGRPLLLGLGRRAVAAVAVPGGDAQVRQAEPVWRDLQGLARTLLAALAPEDPAGPRGTDFVHALREAAADVPGPCARDIGTWMSALALPERRARVRLNRDFEAARLAAQAARGLAPAGTALGG